MNATRCPKCSNRLVQKSESGVKFRIQGAVTIGEDGICKGQCYWCKSEVTLPLELAKSFEAPKAERFVIVERVPAKPDGS